MSKERELLKKIWEDLDADRDNYNALCDEIKELLAQPEPRQDSHCYWCDGEYDAGARLAQLEQEPVAWMYERQSESFIERTLSVGFEKNFDGITIPLYLAPPKREPLSEDRLSQLYGVNIFNDVFIFARQVEMAHGIGVDDNG